jgi:uncharacterized protein (DUF2225 family)
MPINVPEVKRRLVTLLDDENLANEYIRRFGPKLDIKNIKQIKDSKKAQTREDEGAGKDPIYEIKLKCPVCNTDDVIGYELYGKSQAMTFNKFMVPVYEGAMGFRTINFSRLAVIVCPRCLCASPDKKDFIALSSIAKSNISQLPPNTLMTLQERIGERKALLKSVSDPKSFFRRPRTDDAAILSYRLALLRASVEAYYEIPYAYYKMGAYCLKIAQIFKNSGGNNEEHLKEALDFYSDAFRLSNCPSEDIEYQTIYTIIALQMRLGNDSKAASYIGVLDRIESDLKKKMREDPKVTLTYIDKWLRIAKTLWEDRSNPDLFKGC